MTALKPLLELELRPIAAPAHATDGAVVYALLPPVEELLGMPGFGRRNAIVLPNARRPFDPWELFGNARDARDLLH